MFVTLIDPLAALHLDNQLWMSTKIFLELQNWLGI